jgi:hypothetical protein
MLMSGASEWTERYVMLHGGLCIPVEPVLLLLDLEARGFSVTQDGDLLVVCPGKRLTDADCTAVQRWKQHLLALINYEAPGGQ